MNSGGTVEATVVGWRLGAPEFKRTTDFKRTAEFKRNG